MNTLPQPQKSSLIDRLLIGALILLGSLLIGIQIAKAAPLGSASSATTVGADASTSSPTGTAIGDLETSTP